MSRMAKNISSNDDDDSYEGGEDDSETSRFDARTHIKFFTDIVKLYGLSFDQWVLCYLDDKFSVNKSIYTFTKRPLVGCNNHKLNIEVSRLIK